MRHIGGGVYEQTFDDDGPKADCWVYEDLVYINKRHVAAVGFDRDDMTMSPITYDEMRPGCYDPKARVDDMEMNWVDASLSFPTFPRFCGQTFLEAKDRELAHACVLAYNDWMVDEWCGDSGGRLIPLTIVPLWDRGSSRPPRSNATRHAACTRCASARSRRSSACRRSTAVNGIRSSRVPGDATPSCACTSVRRRRCRRRPRDAPVAVAATLSFNNAMASLSDFLFSGVLVRFPQLNLAYSEGQIGWLPYVLERADDVWREHRAWGGVKDIVPEPPSTYYYRQVYGCFFRDRHGLESLDRVGVDNITFETDYPHTDSTWPDTKAVAEDLMGHLPDEVVYKIVRGNAIRMLSLDLDY